jgi:superfamily II DNA or RNA helicase
MHRFGDRFRLLIADEAHHFGNGQRDESLEMSVAPLRLGLTATPLTDGEARKVCERLIGPEKPDCERRLTSLLPEQAGV